MRRHVSKDWIEMAQRRLVLAVVVTRVSLVTRIKLVARIVLIARIVISRVGFIERVIFIATVIASFPQIEPGLPGFERFRSQQQPGCWL